MGAFIWNTKRGQGGGGIRLRPYSDTEEYVRDGMRLAIGMGRKNALAGLWHGGAKGVVVQEPGEKHKDLAYRRDLFEDYGDFLTSLRGCYNAAEDVGLTVKDCDIVFSKTRFTTCALGEADFAARRRRTSCPLRTWQVHLRRPRRLWQPFRPHRSGGRRRDGGGRGLSRPHRLGGLASRSVGRRSDLRRPALLPFWFGELRSVCLGADPAEIIFISAIHSAGLKVAVQGAGNVGLPLICNLLDRGAKVVASDPNADRLAEVRTALERTFLLNGTRFLSAHLLTVQPPGGRHAQRGLP